MSMLPELGSILEKVETPALVLQLGTFEANVARMARKAQMLGMALRPHAKSHKSSRLAQMQVLAGAVGVCVAKLTEAEAMVRGGVSDILITNQIVSPAKINRLVHLASKSSSLSVCVDNPLNVDMLRSTFCDSGQTLNILVEVDVGQGRCGVSSAEQCASLATQVANSPGLNFLGLQCYSGWNQHVADLPGRRKAVANQVVAKVEDCIQQLSQVGLAADVISGAGTGTWALEGSSDSWTELQPGSYAFMDMEYALTDPVDDADGHFEHSLFVASTVISDCSSHPGWIVLDAGDKAISPGAASIRVHDQPSLSFRRGGDEHGIVEGPRDILETLPIGSQVLLIPGHCDPTMNFYDEFIGLRNGRVDEIINIDGRGPGR